MPTSNLRHFRSEYLALGLLLFTGIFWLLYVFAFNRVFAITPTTHTNVSILTDQREGGGSTASLSVHDSVWVFEYEIKSGAPYPFTLFHIDLSNNGNGVNLTDFEEILIWSSAEGYGADRIRFDLRNAHSAYYVPNDTSSFKYNEVAFPSRGIDSPLRLTWNDFYVAGWWVALKNIPFGHRGIDISNVHMAEFVTPEMCKPGKGIFKLKRIEFRGKWVSEEAFFRALLIVWMVSWGLFALVRIRNFQLLIKEKEKHELELMKLNNLLAIQSQEFKTKAMRDELTGLLNRHGLRDQLFHAIENTRVMGIHLSILFVDIDHFKQINDTRGHDAGDQILAKVAEVLAKNLRETDFAARWGGEEFIIVAQGIALESAVLLAEKLRQLVMKLPDNVTCSFGVATLRGGGSIQETIELADKALYKAKENGRNRVESTIQTNTYTVE